MPKAIDGAHLLRTTIVGKVTGRKTPIHEAAFIDTDPNKFPASKIASELAKVWKAAKAEERLADKPISISIRLTPRKV